MYDAPKGSSQYYIIERTGKVGQDRFLKTLGKVFLIGEDPDRSAKPSWGYCEHAFRFDTYTSACHWLMRWNPRGTHQLVYVDLDEGIRKYVPDGPVDPERFAERDWQEFHEMNGRSN